MHESYRYSSPVSHGKKEGRAIGFPTLNLDPTCIPIETQEGVWAAKLKIQDKLYAGAAYFGPRTIHGETKNVLEIFVLDFSQEIYDQIVQFSLLHFLRPVVHFSSFDELKAQLADDVTNTKEYFAEHPLV